MRTLFLASTLIAISMMPQSLWATDYTATCQEIMAGLKSGDFSKLDHFFQSRDTVIQVAGSGKSVADIIEILRPLVNAKARFVVVTKDFVSHPHNATGEPISASTSEVHIGNERIPWISVKNIEITDIGDHRKTIRDERIKEDNRKVVAFLKDTGPRPAEIVTSRYNTTDQARIFNKIKSESVNIFVSSNTSMSFSDQLQGTITEIHPESNEIIVTFRSGLDGDETKKIPMKDIIKVSFASSQP